MGASTSQHKVRHMIPSTSAGVEKLSCEMLYTVELPTNVVKKIDIVLHIINVKGDSLCIKLKDVNGKNISEKLTKLPLCFEDVKNLHESIIQYFKEKGRFLFL